MLFNRCWLNEVIGLNKLLKIKWLYNVKYLIKKWDWYKVVFEEIFVFEKCRGVCWWNEV